MNLSITTDYVISEGDPAPALRRIAEAGFTHLHWCHHWNTDFVYYPVEVEQIARWLRELDLQVLNVHGSDGREKRWYAPEAYRRLAGVELVRNRREMAAQPGSMAFSRPVLRMMRVRPSRPSPSLADSGSASPSRMWFFRRSSRRSRPTTRATSSIWLSSAKQPCGAP